jgi:hypothetical protein
MLVLIFIFLFGEQCGIAMDKHETLCMRVFL